MKKFILFVFNRCLDDWMLFGVYSSLSSALKGLSMSDDPFGSYRLVPVDIDNSISLDLLDQTSK